MTTLAALNVDVDTGAFIGGVQLGVGAILLVLAIWGGIALFRRIVGA